MTKARTDVRSIGWRRKHTVDSPTNLLLDAYHAVSTYAEESDDERPRIPPVEASIESTLRPIPTGRCPQQQRAADDDYGICPRLIIDMSRSRYRAANAALDRVRWHRRCNCNVADREADWNGCRLLDQCSCQEMTWLEWMQTTTICRTRSYLLDFGPIGSWSIHGKSLRTKLRIYHRSRFRNFSRIHGKISVFKQLDVAGEKPSAFIGRKKELEWTKNDEYIYIGVGLDLRFIFFSDPCLERTIVPDRISTCFRQQRPAAAAVWKCKSSSPVKISMPIPCSSSNEVPVISVERKRFEWTYLDGRKEYAMFDKITSRIHKLSEGLDLDYIDPVRE